ncbi:MAG: hypothetical protein JO141_12720 [Bradyrhizobium sp.]|nr:hypothetical protein [Bradyrhizobium sp.]
MNRLCTVSVLALVLSGAIAHAAPPTVVPSPGYDARLQEQHKALSSTSTPTSNVAQPTNPPARPPARHHSRRTQ